MAKTGSDPVQTPDSGNLDREQKIRQRAYEISQSDDAGTPEENWDRAEREVASED